MNAPRWTSGAWLTLAWLAFVSSMLAQSLDLSQVAARVPGIIVPGTLLLLIVQLIIESGVFGHSLEKKGTPGSIGTDFGEQSETLAPFSQRFLLSASWVSLLTVSAWLLGLVLGPALFCLVFLRWFAGQSWRFSLGYAAVVLLFVLSMFSLLLKVSPYPGVIAGLLD